jgi:hypothetical protein
MSDRIDELVLDGCVFVACPRPQDCDTCPLTQLATIAREADKWRKVAEAGVCPVCHMRSRGGYWRDEHGLGHVCTHAYHAALAAAEQEAVANER